MLNTKNKNKGQVLVLVALSLVVFIGFAALAIDVAYFYHTRHQLQGAADAAALAGAALLSKNEMDKNQTAARNEAARIASLNKAAGASVILASDGGNTPPRPAPLPDSNDITVGFWNGTNYIRDSTPVNAVEVRARRTAGSEGKTFPGGTETNKGAINTFFGKIFNITTVNVSATAIAAISGPVLPVAVNEYWMQREFSTNPNQVPYTDTFIDGNGNPRNIHEYPSSFVRQINVDGSNSEAFGRSFAILGSDADDNVTPAQDVNSYVYMDTRSFNYDGSGVSWFDVNPNATPTCGTCGSGFFNTTPIEKKTGDVSQTKFDESSLKYVHEGFPRDYIYPTAVRERFRNQTSGTYPSTTSLYPKPTSECPYATVPFYAGGGNPPINQTFEEKRFYQRYPSGTSVVALVYDGTFTKPTPQAPNAGLIVGYVLLEIDGYANEVPRLLDLGPGSRGYGGNKKLGSEGSTVYAHARESLIQPTVANSGKCDPGFIAQIKELQWKAAIANPRLVE